MSPRRLFVIANILSILSFMIQGGLPRLEPGASGASIEGTFFILWGDGIGETSGIASKYFLTTADDQAIQMFASPEVLAQLGGPLALNLKRVIVQGIWLDAGERMQIESIALENSAQAVVQGVYGSQPWVSLLCKFSDYTTEPKTINYFKNMYSSQYSGLDHFWQQNSYNQVNLGGSTAFGWYVLPHARSYYISSPSGSLNLEVAAKDCTAAADLDVNFSPYVGINLMFNADLDGYAWGGAWPLCLDGSCKTWRMTWEPPWGYGNIGVIAHEIGHGFGLPHSEGNCQQIYDNRWDVMSDVWSNGKDPTYGTMGQHTISYHKQLLGWLTSEQVFTAAVGTLTTITLEKLALPQSNNYRGSIIPIDGQANHFYTLEVRQPSSDPVDYDKWLPGFAVIIHEVNVFGSEPAILIDQDGNCITADAGAMFTSGEVFSDASHGITVTINSASATAYVVTINNRFNGLQGVDISGVKQGIIAESYPYTATVSPVNTSLTITYTWEATGFTPMTHVGGTQDTVSFTWDEAGTKNITVTASTSGSTVVDIHPVDIAQRPLLTGVEIIGPETGYVNDTYTFTAGAIPLTTTIPITYTWIIDGGEPITHTAGPSDTLSLIWDTPGLHEVGVIASNPGARVSNIWVITLYARGFLPLCGRN